MKIVILLIIEIVEIQATIVLMIATTLTTLKIVILVRTVVRVIVVKIVTKNSSIQDSSNAAKVLQMCRMGPMAHSARCVSALRLVEALGF